MSKEINIKEYEKINKRVKNLVKSFENRWHITKHIKIKNEKYLISTTYLVFRLNELMGGMYETRVFNSELNDIYSNRYKTKKLAKKGHKETIKKLKLGLIKNQE